MRQIALTATLLAGCGSPPAAVSLQEFDVAPNKVSLSGAVSGGGQGLFFGSVELIDERGCHTLIYVDAVRQSDGDQSTPFSISKFIDTKHRIATAQAMFEFASIKESSSDKTMVFSTKKVINADIHPPEMPSMACGPTGKSGEARIGQMDRAELFATAINTAGYLCARVTDMYPARGGIIVHCIEYRNRKTRASYVVDAKAGTVEPQ